MKNTKISWTDQTANPIRARNKQTGKRGWHCVKVSPGCVNCYAERMNCGPYGNGLPFREDVRSDVELYLEEKVLLDLERQRKGKLTFICDMTDIFQKDVPIEWIAKIWSSMAVSHNTYQVLTKRAERMLEVLTGEEFRQRYYELLGDAAKVFPLPLKNVWLGVSVENQKAADERIPLLLQTPAAVRFLSCEPLLGEINLNPYFWHNNGFGYRKDEHDSIDWVIVGGESGPSFRPMNLDWARSIRDQCVAAKVPFWFKQQSGIRSEMNPTLDGVEWHQFPKAYEEAKA